MFPECFLNVSLITAHVVQVKEGMFDKEKFDDLCWMMTMKKNFRGIPQGALLSERDCFKLFCLFNLLSEDRYPLLMIPEEVNHHVRLGLLVALKNGDRDKVKN